MKFLTLALVCCFAVAMNAAILPKIKTNLKSYATYQVSGIISLPYAEINEPFQAWYDETQFSSRIDYWDGMVSTIQLQASDSSYGTGIKIAPITTEDVLNKKSCFWMNGTAEAPLQIQSVLPDISNWTNVGPVNWKGISVNLYQSIDIQGDKKNTYSYYANAVTGYPVYYEMIGYDSLLGSHYDKYYIEYFNFNTRPIDASVFAISSSLSCSGFPGPGIQHAVSANPMQEFIHRQDAHVDINFENFKKQHSKEYDSDLEHAQRKHTFRHNMRYIEAFNRQGRSHRLAINHFADKTQAELKYLRGRQSSGQQSNGGLPFDKKKYANVELPDSWDWRIYGAVTPVKDQGVCGSCWSFGTTGTIEGQVFLKHGHSVRLSQQNLVDCSWGFGNNGCDGGEDFRAYQWIMKHGGIATEESYGQYLQADGYCHFENNSIVQIGAQLTGYVNVTSGDEEALLLALSQVGPIQIGIDAAHLSFVFYASGVFYEPECHNKPEDLDHAVLAVGYGTLYGEDYWLVKNSWSTNWGNDGYVLMSRKDNNCGVATDPSYPLIV